VLGRGFVPDEDVPNGPRVVVLSRQLWQTRFNGDPAIIGTSLSLGGEPYTVVGVLGDFDFREFGPTPQVWVLFQFDPATTDQGHYFQAARTAEARRDARAGDARLEASAGDFRARFPDAIGPGQFGVQPAPRSHRAQRPLSRCSCYGGAVSFVLLIACANVANLLLVRATGRRREIAIRAAIGGSRGRIIRQVLTESVVLSLAGGLLGLGLGWAGIRALLSVNTAGLPRVGEAGNAGRARLARRRVHARVSLVTGIVFGLIPALQSSRTDLTTTLKESAGRSGTGFRQNKVRSVLVVVEVALALVLLIGSALLIRTAVALGDVDPGFDPQTS
jgi:putative ABC transport system permease protein